jgi:thiamine-monophosphate kinase
MNTSYDEFKLIDEFFKPITVENEHVSLGIGDDAAIVSCPNQSRIAISNDTLVSGVHFLNSWKPKDIAYKAIAVNLSDMAAMGASPQWLSLGLTMPSIDKKWLEGFSQELMRLCKSYRLNLIGGDTTKGPLAINVTICGFLPIDKALCRHGANVGDSIFVSGHLGAAALALVDLDDKKLTKSAHNQLINALVRPIPNVELGQFLLDYASAAIDISDGLTADLNHLCQKSGVGASVFLEKLPIHPVVANYLGEKAKSFVLTSGDEYELCFTVSSDKVEVLEKMGIKHNFNIHHIGYITKQCDMVTIDEFNQHAVITPSGYQHF